MSTLINSLKKNAYRSLPSSNLNINRTLTVEKNETKNHP